MNTGDFGSTLETLLRELVLGAPTTDGFVLNPGDAGLLASLDRLDAEAASASSAGGATIAAHVAHLRYGISLMNRWAAGENPFADADWAAAWKTTAVTDGEWVASRAALRAEAERWLDSIATPREVNAVEANGVVASVAHLAYHLGAIRQIDRALRGPRDSGG